MSPVISAHLGFVRMIALLIVLAIISQPVAVWAQEVPASSESAVAAQISPVLGANHLDLHSETANIAANNTHPANIVIGGELGTTGTVTGGESYSVNPGQLVTQAQYLALQQVLATGSQTLLIGGNGAASSGFATLTPAATASLASLSIPANVAVHSIGFSADSPFNVTGSGNIQGALYAMQTGAGVSAVLNFGSLNVGASGLISGYLPSVLGSNSSFFASSGLDINVVHNLVNSGTITTPGTLSVNTGGSIFNQSLAGTQAVMSAESINLAVNMSSLVNTGLMQALQNVNITGAATGNLKIDNTGGVLQALNGNINLRDKLFNGSGNTAFLGGDVLSRELNMFGGAGNVLLNANNVSGLVSASGYGIQLHAEKLTTASLVATGDPLITSNTSHTIAGDIVTNGNPLTIIAKQDISGGAGFRIDTSAATGSGGEILLVAGAEFQPGAAADTLEITGRSGLGGSINLPNLLAFDSRGGTDAGTQNANGGNQTLIAYANSPGGTSGGEITVTPKDLLTFFPLTTGGDGTGTNGNLLIISEGTNTLGNQNDVTVPHINTSGGSGGGGTITIATATPEISGFVNPVIIINDCPACAEQGAIISGSFSPDFASITNSSIFVREFVSNGANISVFAGDGFNLFTPSGLNTLVSASRVNGDGPGGNILVLAALSDSATDRQLGQDDIEFLANANGAGAGGNINLISRADIDFDHVVSIGADTGNGGEILIVAGAEVAVMASTVTITGQSSFGGDLDGDGSHPTLGTTVQSLGGTSNGSGGDISLIAFEGMTGDADSGRIRTHPGAFVTSNGRGIGSNGNIVLAAGDDDAGPPVFSIDIGLLGSGLAASTAAGGAIRVATSTPQIVGGSVVISALDGSSVGSFAIDTSQSAIQAASVRHGRQFSNGGDITLIAGENIVSRAGFTDNDLKATRTFGSGSGGNVLVLAGAASAATEGNIALGGAASWTASAGAAGKINIIARGNLQLANTVFGQANQVIDANNYGSGSAGDVLLLAGAEFTTSSTIVTTSGPSAIGGSVIWTLDKEIRAGKVGGSGNGGSIQFIAYEGSGLNSGQVKGPGSPTSVIDVSGAGAGSMGSVIIAAGDDDASGADSINIGSVNSSGGSGSVGAIDIATSTPLMTAATVQVDFSNGVNTGGFAINRNTAAIQNASINMQSLVSNGGSVVVFAGNNITALPVGTNPKVDSSRSTGSGSGGSILMVAGVSPLSISGTGLNINIDDAVAANGNGTGARNGGNISVVAREGITLRSLSSNGADTGSGGQLNIVAGASFTVTSTSVSVSSQSQAGGLIDITGGGNPVTSLGGASNGNGNNLFLIAFEGTVGTVNSGGVRTHPGGTIITEGQGSGSNGNVVIAAGDTDGPGGTPAIRIGLIDTGGGIGAQGGTGGGGTIRISTATPVIVGGTVTISQSTAAISSGTFDIGTSAASIQNGNFSSQSLSSNGADITIIAGNDIITPVTNNIVASRAAGTGGGGSLSLTAGAAVTPSDGSATISSMSSEAAGASGFSAGNISVRAKAGIAITGTLPPAGTSSILASGTGNAADGDISLQTLAGGVSIFGDVIANGFLTSGSATGSGGSVTLTSNSGSVSIAATRSVNGSGNVTLQAGAGITVGDGASIDAGRLTAAAESQLTLLGAGTVLRSGSIGLDTFVMGGGSGDIEIGNNVKATSRGGSIGVLASVDIAVGANAILSARAGYLWLSAGDDIAIDAGAQLQSIGKLSDAGGSFTTSNGARIANYQGGGIGVYAGMLATSVPDALSAQIGQRSTANSISVVGTSFDQSLPSLFGGSSIVGQFTSLSKNSLLNPSPSDIDPANGNMYTLNGGVISLDPPDPFNSIVFTGISLLSIGPIALPDVITPTIVDAGGSGVRPVRGFVVAREQLPTNGLVPTDLTPRDVGPISQLYTYCQPRTLLMPVSASQVKESGCESWRVAAGPCQPYYMENSSGVAIIGSHGATLAATGPTSVSLQSGKIVIVASGKERCTIETEMGQITVPSECVAIVEKAPGESTLKVTTIAGEAVQVALSTGGGTTVPVRAAYELSFNFAKPKLNSIDELTHQSSTDRKADSAAIGIDRRKIDPYSVMNDFEAFECRFNCVESLKGAEDGSLKDFVSKHWGVTRASSMLPVEYRNTSLRQAVLLSSEELDCYQLSGAGNDAGMSPNHADVMRTWISDSAEIRYLEPVNLSIGEEASFTIGSGEVLVLARQKVILKSGNHIFSIAPGTIALVKHDGELTKVRNLCETKLKSIETTVFNRRVLLTAGMEIIFGNKHSDFSKHIGDAMARRDIQRTDFSDGQAIMVSDINLVTLMNNSSLLKQIINSRVKSNRAVSERIMLMAACLHLVTGKRGPYMTAPYIMATNPR
jgi:hypothetical protein